MDNINYENFKNICRMCMLDCCINFNIDAVILDIFQKLTDIHFETNDELPQQICLKCFDFINEIHWFSMTCKYTHSALIECLSDYKNKRTKAEQELIEETNKQIEIKDEDEIQIEEHKIEFVKDEFDYDCEANDLITEDVNMSTNDLITPISSNILAENDEETINTFNQNDLINNETISSDSESSTNSISPRNNKKTRGKQNKCEICIGTSFKLRSSKTEHKCEHPSVSNIRKNLKDRKRTHSGGRTYKSEKSVSAKLQILKRVQRTEHPHKCDQCEKFFTLSHNLKWHKRVHSGERLYKCDQCEKSFNTSTNLNVHKRVHTGERPYKCDLCEKSFIQSNHLNRHKRVHTGERSYKCNQCEKSFNTSSNLYAHKRVHTGERPYKCDQCEKSFTQSIVLIRHKRVHTGERPYKCDLCEKSFTQLNRLQYHKCVHSHDVK